MRLARREDLGFVQPTISDRDWLVAVASLQDGLTTEFLRDPHLPASADCCDSAAGAPLGAGWTEVRRSDAVPLFLVWKALGASMMKREPTKLCSCQVAVSVVSTCCLPRRGLGLILERVSPWRKTEPQRPLACGLCSMSTFGTTTAWSTASDVLALRK